MKSPTRSIPCILAFMVCLAAPALHADTRAAQAAADASGASPSNDKPQPLLEIRKPRPDTQAGGGLLDSQLSASDIGLGCAAPLGK